MSLFEQYIDALARDLGIKTNRKGNFISEMFSSYRPSDYRGLIDEYLKASDPVADHQRNKRIQGLKDRQDDTGPLIGLRRDDKGGSGRTIADGVE